MILKLEKNIPRCDDLILAGHNRDIKNTKGEYISFGTESIYNDNDKNTACRTLVNKFEGNDFEEKLKNYQKAINAKFDIYYKETNGTVPENLQTILYYETNAEKQKNEEDRKKKEEEERKTKEEEEAKLKSDEKELSRLEDENRKIIEDRKKIENAILNFNKKTQLLKYDNTNQTIFDSNKTRIIELYNLVEQQKKKLGKGREFGSFSIQKYAESDGKQNDLIEYIDKPPANRGGKKYKKTRRPRKRSRKSAKKR